MSQNYGIEPPRDHPPTLFKKPVRYIVVIDSGGSMVARLYLNTREMVGGFDAAVEEISGMTKGLVPELGALGSEWDTALQGHSDAERASAKIYTLEV